MIIALELPSTYFLHTLIIRDIYPKQCNVCHDNSCLKLPWVQNPPGISSELNLGWINWIKLRSLYLPCISCMHSLDEFLCSSTNHMPGQHTRQFRRASALPGNELCRWIADGFYIVKYQLQSDILYQHISTLSNYEYLIFVSWKNSMRRAKWQSSFANGHPFGIPNPRVFGNLRKVSGALVQNSSDKSSEPFCCEEIPGLVN